MCQYGEIYLSSYNNEDLAYLAGLVDGEGHISLHKHKSPACKRGYSYRVVLCITNSQTSLLTYLQNKFGGRIDKQGKSAFSGRQIYSLRFNVELMKELLPKLLPYLVLKKPEAQIILESMVLTARHRHKDYDDSGLGPLIERMAAVRASRKLH